MKGKHIEIDTLIGKSILFLVFTMMLVAPSPISAVDGIIEINQARVPAILVSSSLFNSIVNKAKETAGQVIDNSLPQESTTPKKTTAPNDPVSSPSTPDNTGYDPVLVKNIQTRLNTLGYNAGKPDGLYGPGTRNAIMAFQKDHSLAATGTPSNQLLSQLNQAKTVAMATNASG